MTDKAEHCGVVCKLNEGTGGMIRNEVMCEEGVTEWAEHSTLWNATVQGQGVSV